MARHKVKRSPQKNKHMHKPPMGCHCERVSTKSRHSRQVIGEMAVYLGSGLSSCAVVLEAVRMGGMVLDLLLLSVLVSVLMNNIAVAVHAAIVVVCIRVVIIET